MIVLWPTCPTDSFIAIQKPHFWFATCLLVALFIHYKFLFLSTRQMRMSFLSLSVAHATVPTITERFSQPRTFIVRFSLVASTSTLSLFFGTLCMVDSIRHSFLQNSHSQGRRGFCLIHHLHLPSRNEFQIPSISIFFWTDRI